MTSCPVLRENARGRGMHGDEAASLISKVYESTSTFYVSLTGGTRAPREEKAPQSRPTARSPDEPLYADTLPTVVSAPECAVYDDCSASQEPVYEELPDQPTQQHREKKVLPFDIPQKSFFEGASKADILGYLEDAKVRGLENLVSDLGTVSFEALAEDTALDKLVTGDEELVCPKCEKKRTERREIITEIVQTELKYGHDLRIVKEAENSMETREWLKQLRYHAKDLGSWRRRRNGMANIMINGMDRY
ncbi:hypothetical protein IscW_ISCW014044 [Ixodes scapularis]|uniref:Uncharacterized protein n=1 Tax=Ixodes scapularis TaxID=6945 RepID=B7QMJ5_IXOSC|nr:hypothetical protein IscW_ISCW014044 [Ixodes scapularis]|eukprot:XP_002416400.1 hypothetical protein IscW_ISCW014044 [Ixodes scapularis]